VYQENQTEVVAAATSTRRKKYKIYVSAWVFIDIKPSASTARKTESISGCSKDVGVTSLLNSLTESTEPDPRTADDA
jgi:hypothetical protein